MYNKNVIYNTDYDLFNKQPMTIIIGAKGKDFVLIGADSQATNLENKTKKLETQKVFESKTHDKKISFIYAGAGEIFFQDIIIDIIKKIYKRDYGDSNSIQNPEQFRKICKEAMDIINTDYEKQRELEKNNLLNFRLLIGFSVEKQQELFIIRPNGMVETTKDFQTIGTQSQIAELFIIRLRNISNEFRIFDDKEKLLNSVLYVIYNLKQFDLYCGGKSQYMILNNDGSIIETDENLLMKLEENIPEFDKAYKGLWSKIIGHKTKS